MPPPPPSCPCCRGAVWRELGRKRGEFIREEFTYFRCAACGYVRVEPFAGYGIYDAAYYQGHGADPFVDYAAEYQDYRGTARVLEFADLFRAAGDYFAAHPDRTPRRIDWLDFGCGAGGLLKYLRDENSLVVAGTRVPLALTGHDVGAYAEKLSRNDGFRLHTLGELEALAPASFDVISLIEVIEHVPTPDATIALCARLLRPGGLLLLTTGNFACPMARWQGLAYRYCIPEIHVSLFSPGSLRALYGRHALVPWPVHYRGCVSFKVLKSVAPRHRAAAARLLAIPGVRRGIDAAYGVSQMPCAFKPFG